MHSCNVKKQICVTRPQCVKLLVATVRLLFCSVHFARYEMVACTTTLALHPAGRLTTLAVASHFIPSCRGPHINSWSPREFSSVYSLSVSPFVPSLYADAPRSHPSLALLVTCWHVLLQRLNRCYTASGNGDNWLCLLSE